MHGSATLIVGTGTVPTVSATVGTYTVRYFSLIQSHNELALDNNCWIPLRGNWIHVGLAASLRFHQNVAQGQCKVKY